MPSITNDSPPMNEIVLDGVNGICVDSVPLGRGRLRDPGLRPGLRPAHRRDRAARRRRERERLAAGAIELRENERSWQRTVEGLGGELVGLG